MELLLDHTNKRLWNRVLMNIPDTITKIQASIAFNKSSKLINISRKLKINLDWFGLFGPDEPTDFKLIRSALNSDHIRFYPLINHFHPKLIFFHGYGLYIGSANMTESALFNNIEAGIFLTSGEIEGKGFISQLKSYFEYLYHVSVPFTEEDWNRLQDFLYDDDNDAKNYARTTLARQEHFDSYFMHLGRVHPASHEPEDRSETSNLKIEKRKTQFMQEWRETQQFLNSIKERMFELNAKPLWVQNDAHPTIVTDQFVHAYYSKINAESQKERSSLIVSRNFEKNKYRRNKALDEALGWWKNLKDSPSNEAVHIHEWGPINANLLSKENISKMTVNDFATLLLHNHAAVNHARQIRNSVLGLPDDSTMPLSERVEHYAHWLFERKTSENRTVKEILLFLVWNESLSVEERLFIILNNSEWRLDHLGKSILGEIAGWGRPDIYHLRNNRVNKGLRCLGYDVFLYND